MASWSPRELVERLLREILTSRVCDVARETPLETATGLSSRVGVPVLLKREDLQPVFSFKLRGAYNKIAQLEPDRQSQGVACASAGNHAQGVAYAARALAVAGLKRWMATNEGGERPLVAILSGANMNFDRLRFVAERAELGEAREAVFRVTIPERPGAFRAFCAAVGPRVVTEFNYRFRGGSDAHIFVGVGTSSRADASVLQARLEAEGYPVVDLSDDEMAKLHVRHLVGGRAAGRGESGAPLSIRVSGAPGGPARVSRQARRPMEHQPVPLPQPRRGLWPCVGGLRGARRRTPSVR